MIHSHASLDSNQRAFRGWSALVITVGHMLLSPIYHMGFASPEQAGWLGKGLLFYFLAVDGFFLLSGMLLTLSYWDYFTRGSKSRDIDRFYLKRLARIYPMHLFGVAVIGFYALVGIPHPIASGLEDKLFAHWEWTGLLNLLLMQGWGILPVASWNEPSWTLSILFMLYVLFPNLVLGMKRLPQRAAIYVFAVPGLIIGYYVLRHLVDIGSGSDGAGGLARGVVFFISGMMLARLYQLGWKAGWRWDRLLGVALLLLPVIMVLWWQVGPFDMLPFHLTLAMMVLCLPRADGRISRLFANRVSLWFGTISFALYLLHYPIILLIDWAASVQLKALAEQGVIGLLAAYLLSLSVTIGGAYLGYRLIERPADRLLRGAGKNRKTV